jgi:hypothetical protein
MAKRHEDAVFIQGGACNIVPLAKALENAAREAREEGIQPSEDAAVRLIVHQLAFLTNYYAMENDMDYIICITECKSRSPYHQIKQGNACEYPRKEAV